VEGTSEIRPFAAPLGTLFGGLMHNIEKKGKEHQAA
jgi:hypothetical protein